MEYFIRKNLVYFTFLPVVALDIAFEHAVFYEKEELKDVIVVKS